MLDIHLINMTLAGFGIAAGAAVLIAASIIVIAAMRQHRITVRRDLLAAARAAGAARAARVAATASTSDSARESVLREPALH